MAVYIGYGYRPSKTYRYLYAFGWWGLGTGCASGLNIYIVYALCCRSKGVTGIRAPILKNKPGRI